MFFLRRHGKRLLALILILLLAGCGGGGSSATPNPGSSLSRIEVTPSQPSIAKGSTLNLTATGIYNDNSTRTLTNDVSWQSSDESIATLSSTGETSALAAGQVNIQATLEGISGDTDLTVTNAVLSRLEINPGSAQLAKGTRQSLSLFGHYSDGSTQDVTEQATWVLSDTSIASLTDPIIQNNFWLTGLAVGSTQLTASLGAINAQADVTINAANLIQLVISPEAPELPLGTSLELTALGLYSDGSSQVLTQQVSWNSADTGILSISESGRIQPQSIGSTSVTATFAGIISSHTVSISDAVLTAIEVSTPSITLPVGTYQPLLALGHYSDGSVTDITEEAVWQSTSTARMNISNADGSRGLATALAAGTVTVTATLGEIVGSLDLGISAATLSSIDISPNSTRLAVGTQTEFQATGHYSDGSIRDISAQVSWAADDPVVAGISNANGVQGKTLALSQGSTTVSATLDGVSGNAMLSVTAATLLSLNIAPSELTLPAGIHQSISAVGNFSDGSVQTLDNIVSWESDAPGIAVIDRGELTALQSGSARISARWEGISGNTTVTVNDATLSSLQINSSSLTLVIGTEAQFQAIALYSDGSQWDVTNQVTWNSNDSNRLRTDNSEEHRGWGTALQSGNVVVSAGLGGVQAETTVSIGNATLTDLRIVAASTSLDSAEQQQLTALGDFSDGSTQDLTTDVIWNTDAPNLAYINNNDSQHGLVIAGVDISGVAVITANFGGLTASLNLTINNTPQRPTSLVIITAPNAILNDGIDTSDVEIRVQAASPGAVIADGTVIDLQIRQAGISLSSQSLVTTNGIASTSFTTTDTGLFQLEASIGSTLRNSTAVYSSATIYDVIAGAAFADVQNIGTLIPSGSRFGFFMYNLSNRDFPLARYELHNGPDTLFSTTDPLALNGYVLGGGVKMGIIVTLNADINDQGIEARYYLTDPATGNPFYFSVTYSAP